MSSPMAFKGDVGRSFVRNRGEPSRRDRSASISGTPRLRHVNDRAERVPHLRQRNEFDGWTERLHTFFDNIAVVINRGDLQLGARCLGLTAAGDDIVMVFEVSDEDFVTGPDVCSSPRVGN
jgi:hypothetical protein